MPGGFLSDKNRSKEELSEDVGKSGNKCAVHVRFVRRLRGFSGPCFSWFPAIVIVMTK
jgi:hypothetical protein